MAAIFLSRPGQVTVAQNPGGLPMSLFLEGWGGFESFRAIITQVGFTGQGNYQFLHSLNEFIYVYTFGERVADVQVSGLAFSEACKSGVAIPGPTGVERIINYYDQLRLSRTGQPLVMQIGVTSAGRFHMFLTGIRANVVNPKMPVAQFTLNFKAFPREARR